MLDAQYVTDLVVAIATVAAAVFAGGQVGALLRQRRAEQRLEIEAVSITWRPTQAPYEAGPDGKALWKFEITLANPGRMPIDNVRCAITFDRPIERRHWDRTFEPPATSIELGQAVVLGQSTRVWERTLRADFTPGIRLDHRMSATIIFTDMNGDEQTNRWPRAIAAPRPADQD
ncbi:hypothetical protein [Promicromonospora soli]|uniref:Uncharacterized protein n=1 Tax=Promicromonospora soli TaxID=2035533 RepID=A0A919G6D7_9MICO|nr:hypothetical protein [Promicromonospora soli]GHH78659.1 hypothetical protein GCM10017772_42460 [Promicromonospora soli]